MPTYCYTCDACEAVKEEWRKIPDMNTPLEEPCWKCGAEGQVRRKVQLNAGFQADVPPTKYRRAFRETMQKIKKANPINNIPDY